MRVLQKSVGGLLLGLSLMVGLKVYSMGRPDIHLEMRNNEIIASIDIPCEGCYLHEQGLLSGMVTLYKKNGDDPKIIPINEFIDVPSHSRVRKSISLIQIPASYNPYSRVEVDVTLSGDDVGLLSTKRVQSQISRIYHLQQGKTEIYEERIQHPKGEITQIILEYYEYNFEF